jgi:hypothetical protein
MFYFSGIRYGVGFARALLVNVERRFPDGGTGVEERCVGNMLDPSLKGVHLKAANRYESTKNLVMTRWKHLACPGLNMEGEEAQPPLSPTL